MTYLSILIKVALILVGFLSVVSSAENASSQEKPLAQTKRIIPTCLNNFSTSGNRVVPTLPQQVRNPSARSKLLFVRGGSERSLVASAESGDDAKTPLFSRGVESVRVSKRRWKRKEMFALFLLRIGFLINLPFSILFLALSLVFWSLTIIVRILTLNFVARDLSSIAYALSKGMYCYNILSATPYLLLSLPPIENLFNQSTRGFDIRESDRNIFARLCHVWLDRITDWRSYRDSGANTSHTISENSP